MYINFCSQNFYIFLVRIIYGHMNLPIIVSLSPQSSCVFPVSLCLSSLILYSLPVSLQSSCVTTSPQSPCMSLSPQFPCVPVFPVSPVSMCPCFFPVSVCPQSPCVPLSPCVSMSSQPPCTSPSFPVSFQSPCTCVRVSQFSCLSSFSVSLSSCISPVSLSSVPRVYIPVSTVCDASLCWPPTASHSLNDPFYCMLKVFDSKCI